MTEETLFHEALAKPPAERVAFLDSACAGQSELRAAVEALLAAHEASGNPLDRPPAEFAQTLDSGAGIASSGNPGSPLAATTDRPPPVAAATVIAGRYTLVERIGEGGMGEVWVAKQTEPVKRKVALKLIKPGMDSKSLLARFEQERQALAVMDHPNIAKVLDGGVTESGRPFFVMELVNGLPLCNFCDEAKLTIKERLELFTAVCQAIQHAHQKGIIHRDLKPSNILVARIDGKPVPKVIDFGVAKATAGRLTDSSLSTQFGAVVGTLEYMSPEQAAFSGDDIDTRADIYSLGVILYELLTGLRPIEAGQLQNAGLMEMFRIIKEVEPSRPSTRLSKEESAASLAALRHTDPKKLTSLLRGELDWVVMRCLEKQRDRRYETTNGLGRDIQRYLADEPVEARPPTAAYRLQKFIRRNQGRVIAAVLVLLALVAGVAGTSWGMITARQALEAEAAQRKLADQARIIAEDQKNQKEEQRKRADEERARAEKNATEALAEKKRANAKEADALAEKDRADRNAANVLREKQQTEKALLRSEWLLYANQIASALREWETDNVSGAWQHLNECRRDFRGWEYNYLYTLFTKNQRVFNGNAADVRSVAFDPDGKQIVSCGSDGTLKLWDAETGREVIRFRGLGGHLNCAALSPDGTMLVAGGLRGTLKVLDTANGQDIVKLEGHLPAVTCVAISPDGKRFASGSVDGTLKMWDAQTGQETFFIKAHAKGTDCVVFSPDGKQIASGGDDNMLKVWDAATGREILTFKGHGGNVHCAAFSPDGRRIVSGSWDKTLKVWDVSTGQETSSFKGHNRYVVCAAFSPDGKHVISGGYDAILRLWDATSGQEVSTFKGHTGSIASVAFRSDGKKILSGGSDHTVRLWDADSQATLTFAVDGQQAYGIAFSPDGKHVVGNGSDGTFDRWDVANGRKTLLFNWQTRVAFSQDGNRIFCYGKDRELAARDAATGRELLTFAGATGPCNIAVSPDGKRLVTGSFVVTLWDATTGRELFKLGKFNPAGLPSVAFSQDGRWIAASYYKNALTIWDATHGQELLVLKADANRGRNAVFSPDGTRIVTGSLDGSLIVWNTATGQKVVTLKGHTREVYSVAFSPDGTRVVSGSADGTIKVWNATNGQETLTLNGHTNFVVSVAFSPDGKHIASGGLDGTIKIWDAATGPDEEGREESNNSRSEL
jgi:eukaryotic-like serine/threonine-protein kinase